MSVQWFRGSETGFDAPSLVSLVDIGLSPNTPSPHKPAVSLHTIEERLAAGLPLEQQHLPATAITARSASASPNALASRSHLVNSPTHIVEGTAAAEEEEAQSADAIVRALSHMECAVQPPPNLREDTSFYRRSLLDVANKMADLPFSPCSTEAESSHRELPPPLRPPQESKHDKDDPHARA